MTTEKLHLSQIDTGVSIKNKQRNYKTIRWKQLGLSISLVHAAISRF